MEKTKIGLVEDEVIIADDIQALLLDIGYESLEPCSNYAEAIAMLTEQEPDFVMLDINLGGKPDGIDVAKFIRSNLNIPFIFLTANSDEATVARARETRPDAYLIKPFQKADIYVAIEVALYNFNHGKKAAIADKEKKKRQNYLFVKEGDYFQKVQFDEILYLSSEHVYVTIHTAAKKYLVRTSMQEFMEQFDPSKFIRVHRSYIVNIDKVEKISVTGIVVNEIEIPISKNYRDNLLKLLNIQ